MTVKELIEKLSSHDPDMMVVVDGYEEGYDDPRVNTVEIILDVNWDGEKKPTHWSGRHEYAYEDEKSAGFKPVTAVVVGR
jgi:hypothetical protein